MKYFIVFLSVIFLIANFLNLSTTDSIKIEAKNLPKPNATILTIIDTVDNTEKNLDEIKIREKDNNARILKLRLDIADQQLEIIKRRGSTSQEFLRSLQANANLLSTLKVNRELTDEEKETLEFILKDIQVKADCKDGDQPSTTYYAPSKGAEKRFEIWYSTAGDPKGQFRINGGALAETSSNELPAGFYRFWTQDPNNSSRKGQIREEEICREGKEISLPIP